MFGKRKRISDTGFKLLNRIIESFSPYQTFVHKPDYTIFPSDPNNPLVNGFAYPASKGYSGIRFEIFHNPNEISSRTVVVKFVDPTTKQPVQEPLTLKIQVR